MEELIVILGAGESGTGAAILAKTLNRKVFLSDKGSIENKFIEELKFWKISHESGKHSEDIILNATLVIKSPGIPESAEIIQKIRRKGIPVISEIEWAWQHAANSKIIAITGSNGKTTTTALTGHIFKTAGYDAAVVGNIGNSFARQVATNPKPVYIVEVSSFQLDDIKNFKADIAVITNITEDHLDRYKYDLKLYIESKFKIIQNQTKSDYLIYNADDRLLTAEIEKRKPTTNLLPFSMKREFNQGAFIKNGVMTVITDNERMEMSILDFAVKGKHNLYNGMAASSVGSVSGIKKESVRVAVQTFSSLEHRMSHAGIVRGVEFINDSKSTNVNSAWFALESMEKPTVLILGGVDKGNDYSVLEELVKEKVKAIVCMGLHNEKIHEAFSHIGIPITDTSNAVDAVRAAFMYAEKGDVVLLSPACASFDLFNNYEDRGEQFVKAVREL